MRVARGSAVRFEILGMWQSVRELRPILERIIPGHDVFPLSYRGLRMPVRTFELSHAASSVSCDSTILRFFAH